MAFETAIITSEGYSTLAQLTATKTLKLKHIFVDVSEHTEADFAKPVSYWQGIQDTRVASVFTSVGADGNKSRIVLGMKIKPQYSDLTVTVKSIAVSACTLENGTEGVESIIYGLSDPHGIDVIANPSVSITSNVALDIIIDPASSITVEGGTNPNYALQSDLSRFVSCHKAGDPVGGEIQNIYGDKTFKNEAIFDGGFLVTQGAATIDTVDGSCMTFQEDGSKFGYIGYEINDGGLVFTGRESGANNCESIIFGFTSDLDDTPNDPNYFMKMLTNLDGESVPAIQVWADYVIPKNSNLGSVTYKWASVWTNRVCTTDIQLNNTGTQHINFDGESLTFYLKAAANADPMMSISDDDGVICSKPICNQVIRNGITNQIRFYGGDSIEFWGDDGGETTGNIYFFRDDNGALGIQFYDTMFDEEICKFNYEGCRFTGPVNVRSGIKMPYPTTEGELKLGCPCVLKATNGASTAIKMGDLLARDSSGWNVVRNDSTIAGVVLSSCDFSGGNESFVSPLSYATTCRLVVLSSAANGSPFLAMMIEK